MWCTFVGHCELDVCRHIPDVLPYALWVHEHRLFARYCILDVLLCGCKPRCVVNEAHAIIAPNAKKAPELIRGMIVIDEQCLLVLSVEEVVEGLAANCTSLSLSLKGCLDQDRRKAVRSDTPGVLTYSCTLRAPPLVPASRNVRFVTHLTNACCLVDCQRTALTLVT